MKRHIFLILYDISESKKRRELVKVLNSYGYRFQYSCYICNLKEKDKAEIEEKIKKLFYKKRKKGTFKIMLLPICRTCFNSSIWIGERYKIEEKFIIL